MTYYAILDRAGNVLLETFSRNKVAWELTPGRVYGFGASRDAALAHAEMIRQRWLGMR